MTAGCTLFGADDVSPTPEQADALPTPIATPTPASALPPTPESDEGPPEDLTLWLSNDPFFLPDSPARLLLNEQLRAFETNHPDITLNVALKSPTGPGGTLNYLRTGADVAPSALPDVIVLPARVLGTAVAEELIHPLDNLIEDDMWTDLFPAADSLSRVNQSYYGYPISLRGLEHVVYDTTAITETLPVTWSNFLASEQMTLAVAGAGNSGIELAIALYLDSGGSLLDSVGQVALEAETLATAFGLITQARLEGKIPLGSSSVIVNDDSWTLYTQGDASAVVTDAAFFLPNREAIEDSGYGSIPGVDGPLPPLVQGWIWAISTPDPARQALAAELISLLAAGPSNGEWSLTAQVLPARRAAFEQWPADDEYIQFIQAEMERAMALPFGQESTLIGVLDEAVAAVFSLTLSPQAAAAEVLSAFQP